MCEADVLNKFPESLYRVFCARSDLLSFDQRAHAFVIPWRAGFEAYVLRACKMKYETFERQMHLYGFKRKARKNTDEVRFTSLAAGFDAYDRRTWRALKRQQTRKPARSAKPRAPGKPRRMAGERLEETPEGSVCWESPAGTPEHNHPPPDAPSALPSLAALHSGVAAFDTAPARPSLFQPYWDSAPHETYRLTRVQLFRRRTTTNSDDDTRDVYPLSPSHSLTTQQYDAGDRGIGVVGAIGTVGCRADAYASPRNDGDHPCAAPQFPEQPPPGELPSFQGPPGEAPMCGAELAVTNLFGLGMSLTSSSDFESFNTDQC